MSVTVAISFRTIPVGENTRGTTELARFIDEESKKGRDQLLNSYSFGTDPNSIQKELQEVMEQCSSANWDGYGAESVKWQALLDAFRFAEVIPLGLSAPTVGAEPDGDISFEWHAGPRRTLSVSVDEKGNLHYSALLGLIDHTERRLSWAFFRDEFSTLFIKSPRDELATRCPRRLG